jgi:integrase
VRRRLEAEEREGLRLLVSAARLREQEEERERDRLLFSTGPEGDPELPPEGLSDGAPRRTIEGDTSKPRRGRNRPGHGTEGVTSMHEQRTAPPSRHLVRTRHPGIFRRGNRYVVIYRDHLGAQRKQAATTIAEARDLQAKHRADVARGEYQPHSKVSFAEYATDWIETFNGRTSRGIRDATRSDYRKRLEADAVPFFGRTPLVAIGPPDVKRFIAQVAARGVAPNTVRLSLAPVRALFATAVEDGLIRSNPAAGVRIAGAAQESAEEEQVKALTGEELASLLEALPEGWRLFFAFLAHTGLRIGEAIALRWQDLDLVARRVRVRRRYYRGDFAPPKSRYGRRDIPLSAALALELGRLSLGRNPDELVFASERGTVLDASNLMSRVLKPAAAEVGLGEWLIADGRRTARSWVGFHTFRHTCATLLFRAGLNAKQVQMWLGHHSPSFTLATYVHLLADDLPDVAIVDLEGATGGQQDPPSHSETRGPLAAVEAV